MNHRHLAFLPLALVAAFVGCGSSETLKFGSTGASSSSSSSGAGGAGGSGGSAMGGAGGAGGSAGSGGAPAITYPQACSDVYAQNIVPTFELTFSPQELDGLMSDCQNQVQQYRPIKFTYGTETVDAMARLKGNWSWSCDKMQFVVSFNEVDPKGRFHGLRKMVFDAPWYDRTLLHERTAMSFFAERGLPYSCVNNARVMLNGQYYGLFSNVERLDKEYLQRHFELADGNLYQAGNELKTNETIGDTSDRDALNAAQSVAELATMMDLDQAVAEWATEAMLPAVDNYWAGVEINYYIYHHPTRGFLYLPYDMDLVFGDNAYPDGSLIWPDAAKADPITYEHPGWMKEDRVKMVLSDEVWCNKFVEELKAARALYSPTVLAARVHNWNVQITESLGADPRKPFTMADHDGAMTSLKAFFQQRATFVDQWLAQGNHCPGQF